ncbi:OPT family oligopeptide transporter [Uliginosibacterium sp. sgz301328]|uniref:OPT family oligopeptide transporter n=1 Tax=Uliginosibacterium sp. sgz301328 TaxID=3243764 RepID=UPI00359DE496
MQTRSETAIDVGASLPELTLRGVILGALITVVFTASNVYLGLKVGLTFSSSIPAAVISMAVLSLFSRTNILENNMVQTQASAAGTLSSIIFVLPALVMVGHWQGFPFWQTLAICMAGGMLGVLFTIPLRHAMVVQSSLPYPEGVAAAEILRVGSGETEDGDGAADAKSGMREIAVGGATAALFSFAASGLRVLADSAGYWFSIGRAVFQLPIGFSFALIGAGYLIGIVAGVAIIIGLLIAWGVGVPLLSAQATLQAGQSLADFGGTIWRTQVRFVGAGVIAIAAVWTLVTLIGPVIEGVKRSFAALTGGPAGEGVPRTEQDLSSRWIIIIAVVMLAVLGVTFAAFLATAPTDAGTRWMLVGCALLFTFVFGFLIAAACGYMAGLVGSSSSPISGIGIIGVTLVSLLILGVSGAEGLTASPEGRNFAIALALFITAAVVAVATISNDNLQDLKTGWLVGATPWRQQVALLIGCAVGAAVISPVLELLYHSYGFAGALPREGMDPSQVLSAPQATLMTAIASGIFNHKLDWDMLLIGVALGAVLIVIDAMLRRRGGVARLPVLAVGLGIYLPPTVTVPLAFGAVIAWFIELQLRRRAVAQGKSYKEVASAPERRGVLIASGLIVGESLVGVLIAAIIGASGSDAPLAVVGAGFAPVAQLLSLVVFLTICCGFVRRVLGR